MVQKPRDLADYEKTVIEVAGRLFSVHLVAVRNDEELNISDVVSDAITDAFELVDGVLECTRG